VAQNLAIELGRAGQSLGETKISGASFVAQRFRSNVRQKGKEKEKRNATGEPADKGRPLSPSTAARQWPVLGRQSPFSLRSPLLAHSLAS